MPVTITAIETIPIRIPLDIWAPPPDVPRSAAHACRSAVRAGHDQQRGGGLGRIVRICPRDGDRGLRPLGPAPRGRSETSPTTSLIPRIERSLLSLGRAGPMMGALSGLDIALWDIRGKLEGVPVSTASRRREAHARRMLRLADAVLWRCRAPEAQYRPRARTRLPPYQAARAHRRCGGGGARGDRSGHPADGRHQLRLDAAEAEAPVAAMAPRSRTGSRSRSIRRRISRSAPVSARRPACRWRWARTPPARAISARMVATGATDFVQPSIVKIGGISRMVEGRGRGRGGGAMCVPNGFYIGPGYLAAVHCMAVKENASPLERMFCRSRRHALCEDRAGGERRGRGA